MAAPRTSAATVALGLALLAASLVPLVSAQSNLNSFSYMSTYRNGPACVATWEDMRARFYSASVNNTACGDLVFTAMNTIIPEQCPGGRSPAGDRPGGELWNCMTGNGQNAELKSSWKAFIEGCEIFYVAYRKPGEAESGFKAADNSCLRRFKDTASFVSYLNGAGAVNVIEDPTGAPSPNTGNGGSAEGLAVRAMPIALAFLAAVAFMLAL